MRIISIEKETGMFVKRWVKVKRMEMHKGRNLKTKMDLNKKNETHKMSKKNKFLASSFNSSELQNVNERNNNGRKWNNKHIIPSNFHLAWRNNRTEKMEWTNYELILLWFGFVLLVRFVHEARSEVAERNFYLTISVWMVLFWMELTEGGRDKNETSTPDKHLNSSLHLKP